MPFFSDSGADTWLCQKCYEVFASDEVMSEWRPDITGNDSAANVCPDCVEKYSKKRPHEV